MPQLSRRAAALLAHLAVAVGVLIAYEPVRHNAFVGFDDDVYVTANPVVRQGLTAEGVRWAFTTGEGANWHPLTRLSHMADVSLFGLDPRGHHATSVGLHLLNAALVLLLVESAGGSLLVAAAVAALFALHPMRVESVAWAAERKDVLSTLLLLLALAAYVRWARRGSRWTYAGAVALHALGLLAKPMLVTLPLLLLLVDLWPLRRLSFDGSGLWQRIREKAPFFALSLGTGLVAIQTQRASGALSMLADAPLGVRVANAVVSWVVYAWQLVWPWQLAPFYPHPGASLAPALVVAAAAGVVLSSWLAFRVRAERPWLFVGWIWFVVALLPVIGLVQAGAQAHADRYTYVAHLGLLTVLAGEAALLVRGRRLRLYAAGVLVATVLVACTFATRRQVGFWRDQETLFRHAVEVTTGNYFAHTAVGDQLARQGRSREAIPQFHRALAIRPGYALAWTGLGRALLQLGLWDMATPSLVEALRLQPDDRLAVANLALVRMRQGELAMAERLYLRATSLSPQWAEPWRGLGTTRLLQGRTVEAIAALDRAATLEPSRVDIRAHRDGARALAAGDQEAARALRRYLATLEARTSLVLLERRDAEAAIAHLRAALDWDSGLAPARQQLGVVLTQQGRLPEALEQLTRAVELDPASAEAHNDLGYVLSALGRKADAAASFREALRLRPELALAARNLEAVLASAGADGQLPRRRGPTSRDR